MALNGRGGPPRGPKPLSEILNDLFAARGLGRLQARADLESAWSAAVGEPGSRHTRVEALQNGILSVTVAHPTLLEELRSYQKSSLLEALRRSLPETTLHDIRFRVGSVAAEKPGVASPSAAGPAARPSRPASGPKSTPSPSPGRKPQPRANPGSQAKAGRGEAPTPRPPSEPPAPRRSTRRGPGTGPGAKSGA